MPTNYNTFAKTFSKSRKNMKWEELEYFFSLLQQGSILDIWCGSGRLLEQYQVFFNSEVESYFWIDMSKWLIDEAKISFPNKDFAVWNMLDILDILWENTYENIFLIASFHHLETLSEREKMIQKLYRACEPGGKVFMTNWALESWEHLEKYKYAKILNSENRFGSSDFNVKFWKYDRFYHNFLWAELEYLSWVWGFTIIENRLFDNKKNIITMLQK
jgi:SAM-dependent methyltransferase